MMFTAEQCKEVRKTLGLSQVTVAKATGMNNSDISKFENGRLILQDRDVRKLTDHYRDLLGDDPAIDLEADQEQNDGRQIFQIDGIVVPNGFDVDEAEQLMETYHENRERISQILDIEAPRGFFGGLKLETIIKDLVVPMAENFAIIDRIHGNSELNRRTDQSTDDIHEVEGIRTNKDALEYIFGMPSATHQSTEPA